MYTIKRHLMSLLVVGSLVISAFFVTNAEAANVKTSDEPVALSVRVGGGPGWHHGPRHHWGPRYHHWRGGPYWHHRGYYGPRYRYYYYDPYYYYYGPGAGVQFRLGR